MLKAIGLQIRLNGGDEYMQTAQNSGIYKLNTICQYDPDIIPLLHAPYGTDYIRNENGEFQKEHFEPLEE